MRRSEAIREQFQELAGDPVCPHHGRAPATQRARVALWSQLVPSAVPPLMIGSGIAFETRGTHELKGVPGTWQLFAVNDDQLGSTRP